jgi:hypothetical protein
MSAEIAGGRVTLAADTSVDVEDAQIAIWRRQTPQEKLAAVDGANRTMKALAMAGIRTRHPFATDREVFLRYILITLGRELAVRAYPEVADIAP